MGIPFRMVVSDKTIAVNKYEIKGRLETESKLADKKEIFEILALK